MNAIPSVASISPSPAGALLVSGASDALARQAIELLLRHRPEAPLIAATRHPEKLADLSARGVSVRFADFDRPASLDEAFAGASRMLLVSTNTTEGSARRIAQHRQAIEAAQRQGLRHLAYTSFATAGAAQPGPVAADHAATEQLLRDSSLGFSILRNAFYAEMLLMNLPLACASGRLPCAPGRGRMTWVARADCAAAAAAALLDDFEGRRTCTIAGEESLDAHALAALASQVLGVPIEAVEVPSDQLEQTWSQCGASPGMAALFAGIDRATARGEMDIPGSDLRALLKALPDVVPTSLRAFLQAHGAALRPTTPSPHAG